MTTYKLFFNRVVIIEQKTDHSVAGTSRTGYSTTSESFNFKFIGSCVNVCQLQEQNYPVHG